MFPGWDPATLEDVLASRGWDLEKATETLLQWTVEVGPGPAPGRGGAENRSVRPRLDPVSPWHAARLRSLADEGNSANADDGAVSSTRPPARPHPREEYDQIMAMRLARHCGGYERTTSAVWAAARWKRRTCSNTLSRATTGSQPQVSPSATEREMHRSLRNLTREDAIVEGKELLRQRLAFLNFRELEMQDDGNCQFRAVAQELYGSQRFHASVRARVVRHMRRREDDYSAYFDGGDFGAYLDEMSRNAAWGDEFTLRAVAEAFGVRVHILTSTDSNWYLVYEAGPGVPPHGQAPRQLYLTYIAPIHYNVAAPLR